jgi:hypothetical protein
VLQPNVPRLLTVLLLALLIPATAAHAAVSRKKAIAGPVEFDAVSQFPTYAALGAGIYQATIDRSTVTQQAPEDPKDPTDPGYQWPAELDEAVDDGAHYHIQLALTVTGAPSGYADFVTAAARQYPTVHLWLIPQRASTSSSAYAAQLKAAYAALKTRSKLNRVVGVPRSTKNAGNLKLDLLGYQPPANHAIKASTLANLHKAAKKDLFLTGWTLQTNRSTAAATLKAGLKLARSTSYVFTLGYDGLYDPDKVDKTGRTPTTGLLAGDGTKRPAFDAFKAG